MNSRTFAQWSFKVASRTLISSLLFATAPNINFARAETVVLNPGGWKLAKTDPPATRWSYPQWEYKYAGPTENTGVGLNVYSDGPAIFELSDVAIYLPGLSSNYYLPPQYNFTAFMLGSGSGPLSLTFGQGTLSGVECAIGGDQNFRIPITKYPVTLTTPEGATPDQAKITCWYTGANLGIILITSSTATFAPLNLRISDISLSQPAGTPVPVSSDGVRSLESNKSARAKVMVNLNGTFNLTGASAVTSVQLLLNNQLVASQSIDLSKLQQGDNPVLIDFVPISDPNVTGPQKLTAIVDADHAVIISNSDISKSVDIEFNQPLSLSNVHVSQAVNDFVLDGQSNITLVKGKSAVIFGTVKASGNTDLDPSTPITVTATLPDGSTLQKSVTLADAIANDGNHNVAVIGPFVPQMSGKYSLKATGPSPLGDSQSIDLQTVVKQTNDLLVDYVGIEDVPGLTPYSCAGKLRQNPPTTHAEQSTKYIQDTYPVKDGGVTQKVEASSLTNLQTIPSANIIDNIHIVNLLQVSRVKTSAGARNGIGVVPSDPSNKGAIGYFACNLEPGTHGITLSPKPEPGDSLPKRILKMALGMNASLVDEGYWIVSAHEVAHTFGAPDHGGFFSTNQVFDVANLKPITNFDGVWDFMGPSTKSYFQDLSPAWISQATYSAVFKGLLTNVADPKVLIVSGLLTPDGNVQLSPMQISSNGVLTPFDSDVANAVVLRDAQGQVLSQASFLDKTDLQLVTDQGVISEPSVTPFIVQVPYTPALAEIQITKEGAIVTKFSPKSQLLLDAINEISNSSFRLPMKVMRTKLIEKAEYVQQLESRCKGLPVVKSLREKDDAEKCSSRILKTLFSIRAEINLGLNDSTAKSNPTQLTKSEILKVVDLTIINSIPTQMNVTLNGRETLIVPVPWQDLLLSKGFNATQVSNATYGKTEIILGGKTIRYTLNANMNKLKANDSFTFDITNPEGDLSHVTVTIVPK